MAQSDETARRARNLNRGWAQGFLEKTAEIQRAKEFEKIWNPSRNPAMPPASKRRYPKP